MLCDLYFHYQQVLVLMYKDFLLMKRRYVWTAFFFLIPTFIACIPVLLTWTLDDLNPVVVNFYQDFIFGGKFTGRNATNIQKEYEILTNAKPFVLSNDIKQNNMDLFSVKVNEMHNAFRRPKLLNEKDYKFIYSPDNSVTFDLMQQSVTLWVKKMNISTGVSVLAFENEFELEAVVFGVPNMTYLIGTVFQNIHDYLPDSLEYKIRVGAKDEFYTCEHSNSGRYAWIDDFYVETCFLGWQTALEQTFISMTVESNHSKVAVQNALNSIYLNPFPKAEKTLHPKRMFLKQVWPFAFGFAFFIFACCVVAQLTMEKEYEIKTMLVIMRMKRTPYWLSFFIRNLLNGALIVFLLSCCYKFLVPIDVPLFENANLGIIYYLLICFFIKLLLFCMVFSIFFRNSKSCYVHIFI
ncbi:uncharacterized protein LOC129217474 [Uloborus diversus]|uniref:uncharacterized protein LOC129217474 n=1 Tax=Uloborus diversus TaxID=327109 RepID=UPI00240994D5|nr:uncharacterized protein LOC129217474 [Uloborus diversus]